MPPRALANTNIAHVPYPRCIVRLLHERDFIGLCRQAEFLYVPFHSRAKPVRDRALVILDKGVDAVDTCLGMPRPADMLIIAVRCQGRQEELNLRHGRPLPASLFLLRLLVVAVVGGLRLGVLCAAVPFRGAVAVSLPLLARG